jgi:hypothetical protein
MSAHVHTLDCLKEVNGQLICDKTKADPSRARARGAGIMPARSVSTKRSGYEFEWDLFSSKAPTHKPGHATTDRGWCKLASVNYHPDLGKVTSSYLSEHLNVGNYVDSGEGGPEPIFAHVGISRIATGSTISTDRPTSKRFATVTQARNWIERTAAARLDVPSASQKSAHCSSKLAQLHQKHVGKGPTDVPRILENLNREIKFIESGASHASPGLLRELRAERAEIGKLAKACGIVMTQPQKWEAFKAKHALASMPDRGFAISRSSDHYEAYFGDKNTATRAAQLLANISRRTVDLIQIQNHGNDRFIAGQIQPREIT